MDVNEEIRRLSGNGDPTFDAMHAAVAQQRPTSSFLELLELESQQEDYTSTILYDLTDALIGYGPEIATFAYPAVYHGLDQALQAFQDHFYTRGSRLEQYESQDQIPLKWSWLAAVSKSLETAIDGSSDVGLLSQERLGEIWRSTDFVLGVNQFFDTSDLQAQLIFFDESASLTWQSMSMRILVLLHVLQKSLKEPVFALGIVSRQCDGEYKVSIFNPLDLYVGPYNTTLWLYVDDIVGLDQPKSAEPESLPWAYNTWTGFCTGAMTEHNVATRLAQAIAAPHPPAAAICRVLQAPPPWTSLPFAEMQGITGEELLVFFPNHALTWPAICERVALDFPNVADITRRINRNAWGQVNQHGIAGEVITDSEVERMIAMGRREYRGFATTFLDPFMRADPAHYLAVKRYMPPSNWDLALAELSPAYSLAQLASIAENNPNFRDIEAKSSLSRKILQIFEGYQVAQGEQDERNPPVLPAGWRTANTVQRDAVGPERSRSWWSTPSETGSASPSLRGRQRATGPRLGRAEAQMEDLPRHIQNDTEAIVQLGLDEMNGEIILFLRDRYKGALSLPSLVVKLKPGVTDQDELQYTRRVISRRVAAALRHRANLHHVSYEVERAYWKTHLEVPPEGRDFVVLPQGPPPRPLGIAFGEIEAEITTPSSNLDPGNLADADTASS